MSEERRLDGASIFERAPTAHALISRAHDAGISLRDAWLVGGAVRDALLGIEPGFDLDIAVEGDAQAFAMLLAAGFGSDVESRGDFGTATTHVDLGGSFGRVRVDVASCRTETYPAPGALPEVTTGVSIDADLPRRDVRANAIAVALGEGPDGKHRVVAVAGALDDIRDRRLRVLHDRSLIDDPTRIFRIARYAGRLGFRVDDHTRALAIEAVEAGALSTLSADRVQTELRLLLREPAWEALTLLASWGVVERLDPRVEAAFHPPLLLAAIDDACGDDRALNLRAWTLRLAALARPLGSDAAGWMRWLGFESAVAGPVLDHVRVLDAVLERGAELRELPNSELYLDLGEVNDDSFALAALAVDQDAVLLERLAQYRTSLRSTSLVVRGDDVIAAGVPAGPAVGRILGELFLRALDGEFDTEEQQRAAMLELADTHGKQQ